MSGARSIRRLACASRLAPRHRWSSGRGERKPRGAQSRRSSRRGAGAASATFLPRRARTQPAQQHQARPRSGRRWSLATGVPATFTASNPTRWSRFSKASVQSIPPRSPASVSGALDRLEDQAHEEAAGQSGGGHRPRGGSRLRCWRAGSADRRHHRHHHVERRLVDAGRDDHGRIACHAGQQDGGHRRQRHLRRARPAPGRVCRHHRDGRHGDGEAPTRRRARSHGDARRRDGAGGGCRAGHGARQRRARRDQPRPSAPTTTRS